MEEEEFERKYGIDDDWDSELYQKTPSGWIEANSSVKQFLSSALDKVVEERERDLVEKLKPALDDFSKAGTIIEKMWDICFISYFKKSCRRR